MSPLIRALRWCHGPRRRPQHPPWCLSFPLCHGTTTATLPTSPRWLASSPPPPPPHLQLQAWCQSCLSSSQPYPRNPPNRWRRTTAVRCAARPSVTSTTSTATSSHTRTRSPSSATYVTSVSRGRTAWPIMCARTTAVCTSHISAPFVGKASLGMFSNSKKLNLFVSFFYRRNQFLTYIYLAYYTVHNISKQLHSNKQENSKSNDENFLKVDKSKFFSKASVNKTVSLYAL